MASKINSHEEKRARQGALVSFVWMAPNGVTLNEIAENVRYPIQTATGYAMQYAYDTNISDPKVLSKVRMAVHRDRDDLEKAGITISFDDALGKYRVVPRDVFVPGLSLNSEESALLLSLRAAKDRPFGPNGLLGGSFVSRSTTDSRSAVTAVFVRAKMSRHIVVFSHRRSGSFLSLVTNRNEERKIVPLRFVVANGRQYVVGYDIERDDIRGFLLSRIVDVPKMSSEIRLVGDDVVQRARDWSPREFEEGSSIDVTVSTEFAQREAKLHPRTSAVVASSEDGCSELRLSFDTESSAMAWLVMNERNVIRANGKFKSAAKNWLKETNQATKTPARGHSFSDAFDPWSSDEAINLALRMAAAVIAAGELSAKDLASMFSVDVDHVRRVFHELVMARSPQDDTRYFLPITLSDDSNDDGDYDYIAEGNAVEMFGGTDPLAWTEVFAVSLMLEQIQRLAHGTPVARVAESLVAKIHAATDVSLSVLVPEVPFGSEIAQNIRTSALRIKYQSAGQEQPTWRVIAPVEQQFVCGEAYLRAYEMGDGGAYKTYALNRIWDVEVAGEFPASLPTDTASDWLAALLTTSNEVLIETNEAGLPLFENLPEVQVAKEPSNFGFILKIKVANADFLDRRLAAAGKNARVIGDKANRAGVAFATELANRL